MSILPWYVLELDDNIEMLSKLIRKMDIAKLQDCGPVIITNLQLSHNIKSIHLAHPPG